MGFVEGVALTVAGLILLETVVFLLVPERLLALARTMSRYETAVMAFYMILGAVLMYFLLRTFSLIEIMACGIVIAIFYGIVLIPYFDVLVEAFEEDVESGELWGRLAPGFLIWVGLSIGVIMEWGF